MDLYRSRLSKKFNEAASRFVSSLTDDEKIFEDDIYGTKAHEIMLFEQGIITRDNLVKIKSWVIRIMKM